MNDEPTIQDLFQFQDEALRYTLESSIVKKYLSFISDALGVCWATLTSMSFEDQKQTAIRIFGVDTVSSVITGTRIALWGNLPDSLAILRCALETVAILGLIIEDRKYKTANYEVETRTGRFSDLVFENAVKRLGTIGDRIGSTWGRLSNIGPHSTPVRMKHASYELNGTHFDRIGFALDRVSAEAALSLFPDVSLLALDCFEKAFAQDSVSFPFAERLDSLRARFAELNS